MSMTKRMGRVLVVMSLGILGGGVGVAQSTSTIAGTVSDATGAVVPGATVTVHSMTQGTDRVVKSDSAGSYGIASLQPGTYQVKVTAPGFASYTVDGLTLQVDRIETVNAKLAVESAGATVEVTGAAQLIDAQTITVGQVIGKRTVQELPLNGRHFLDLTVLTPGGVTPPAAGNLTTPLRGLGASSFISAGNREDSVNFQMNGVNLNDMVQNQITFQPSINTTSEFKIDNSTPSAEYGRSSGPVVNVSTRSGTNGFHGEAFDYLRNNYFDGRNYFNAKPQRQSQFQRNNFGGALGGPIWRNHTFFFGSYEGLRQRQGIFFNSAVLTGAERTRVMAAGDPAATALLPLIPVANDATGGRFQGSASAPVKIDQYTGDVLHQFNTKDTLHGFYAYQKDLRTEPNLQGDTVAGFGDNRNAARQVLTINETRVFSPNLVNEARLGFNRISIGFAAGFLADPGTYKLGVGVIGAIGIPQITITDKQLTFGGPAGFPQARHDTLMVFSDTATYLKGKHTVKFGGEFRRFVNDNANGDTGRVTVNTTAGFIAGQANAFTITPTTVSSRLFINAAGAFVQDNYKITPNLVLEGGLRFEWNGTPTEGNNRLVVFQPATLSLVRTRTPGQGSVYKQNYNVEPRLGFAYDVFGTAKTVVRGGYGLVVDQPTSNVVTGLASNPPLATTVTYSSSTAPIPLTTLFASARAAGIGLSNVQPDFRNAYTQTFNLNVQQELPDQIALSVGYYGSVGRHLRVASNQNQPVNGGARPFTTLSLSSPIAPGASINSNIFELTSNSSSNYSALWVSAAKSFAKGIEFNVNYNYSKSLDLNSLGSQGGYAYQDSTNPGGNYGLSDFDVRHRFAGTIIYNLPFKGNRFVEGFQISSIVQSQSGNPVNIVNNSTYGGIANLVRPDLVGPIVMTKTLTAQNGVRYIASTSCTGVAPAPGCTFFNRTTAAGGLTGFGNLQRNAVRGPGFTDVDVSLEKNTKIKENVTLQLRADAFDVANHANLGQPVSNDQSSLFGQIFSTRFAIGDVGSARQLQFAAKILF